jgi:hypothetical protein
MISRESIDARALVKFFSTIWQWMFANRIEKPKQVDQFLPIKEKCCRCRATGWREPDDQHEVVAPREMCVPAITTWMIQWHDLAAHWIRCLNLVILVIIAALTGKRQVLQRCRADLGAWNDVLYGEGCVA